MIYKPIFCISDTHLGFEETNYPAINDFLDLVQAEAGSLLVCGDWLDLWRCPLEKIKTEEPMRSCYNKFIELAKTVPVQVIWGNHDYQLAGKVPLQVTDEFVMDGIFFCHGWRMDVEQCLSYPFFGWLVKQFPYIYQKFFRAPFEVKKTEEGEKYFSDLHKIARDYAKRKGYKHVVMGHTHCAYEDVDGIVYDCGDFITNCTYVVVDDSKIKLKKF